MIKGCIQGIITTESANIKRLLWFCKNWWCVLVSVWYPSSCCHQDKMGDYHLLLVKLGSACSILPKCNILPKAYFMAKFDESVKTHRRSPRNFRNEVTISVGMVAWSPLFILFLKPVFYLILNSASLYDSRFLLLVVFFISLTYSILQKSYLKIGHIPVLLPQCLHQGTFWEEVLGPVP